jgi:hypothetical protein
VDNNNGYYKGELCNRNGCKGVIDEHEKESGCSCHINPPCSSCTTNLEFCPICEWESEDEKHEYLEELAKNIKPMSFKRKTLADLDKSKVDWIVSNSWHSGMEITGVYPENLTMEKVIEKLKDSGIRFDKICMGKFKHFSNGKFVYSYFTD